MEPYDSPEFKAHFALCMDAFEFHRNRRMGGDMGSEDYAAREAMLRYLWDAIPDGSSVADVFSGDGVVPVTILYMQEQFGCKKIGKLYCIDDNRMGGFDIMAGVAGSLRVQRPEMVEADANDCAWTKRVGRVDVATVIDVMNRECMYAPMLAISNIRDVTDHLEVVQAGPIHDSYIAELEDAGFAVNEGRNGINYATARLPVGTPHSR